MTEMVDRVARAMFDQDHDEGWDRGEAATKQIYLNNARAAIEAMREPTEEMVDAAHTAQRWSEGFGPDIGKVQDQLKWQAMIDVALMEAT